MKFTGDDLERSDCWNYLGPFHISRHGIPYGRFGGIGAHRVSYEIHKGPIPKGLTIDHLCKNTVCINPDHLEAVDLKVNILRGDSPTAVHARQTHCPKGHIYDKLRSKGFRDCSICKKEYDRAYHWKNRERRLRWNQENYQKNRTTILATKRLQWQKKHSQSQTESIS